LTKKKTSILNVSVKHFFTRKIIHHGRLVTWKRVTSKVISNSLS
jgi:hypothetical protein